MLRSCNIKLSYDHPTRRSAMAPVQRHCPAEFSARPGFLLFSPAGPFAGYAESPPGYAESSPGLPESSLQLQESSFKLSKYSFRLPESSLELRKSSLEFPESSFKLPECSSEFQECSGKFPECSSNSCLNTINYKKMTASPGKIRFSSHTSCPIRPP